MFSLKKLAAFALAAAVFAAFYFVSGCNNNPSGGGPHTFGGLILPTDYAWTDSARYSEGSRDGFVLHSDGSVSHVTDNNSFDYEWRIIGGGEWHIEGHVLTVTVTSGSGYFFGSGEFYVGPDGANLDWDGYDLVKTYMGADVIGSGGNPVLPAGFAWTDANSYPQGSSDGFIFNADNVVIHIDDFYEQWNFYDIGTWSVVGTQLNVTGGYYNGVGSFTVSANGNNLTWRGERFVRTQVGTIEIGSYADNDLILPTGFAWTDSGTFPEGVRDGVILYENHIAAHITDNAYGEWRIRGNGLWYTNGSQLTITSETGAGYIIGTFNYNLQSADVLTLGSSTYRKTYVEPLTPMAKLRENEIEDGGKLNERALIRQRKLEGAAVE